MTYPLLKDQNLSGKRVLLRAGFDVPIENGEVQDTTRIEALVPTMKHIIDGGGKLIIMAHQGRPKAKRVPEMSQKPLVSVLDKLLSVSVKFCSQCRGEEAKKMINELSEGEVLLLENLRYEKEEKSKDETERDSFGKELAELGDIYVNDAFTNCHRDHASMTSVPKFLPGCMGFAVQSELEGLSKAIEDPKRPVTLIISGAKIETKVPIIKNFMNHGDNVLVGGCIANTLIVARGFNVGKSKYDDKFVNLAKDLMLEGESEDNADIHIPFDSVVAAKATEDAEKINVPSEEIAEDMAIFDVGEKTIEGYKEIIAASGTIVWNGPMGVYEIDGFSNATRCIADAVKEATEKGAVSIIGGGDTLDFHDRYDYPMDKYTFVSSAGGAMLDFVAGKKLPALEALK
ncbi:MAG: phosphoglycerate kinase [Candidatus Peribacteraceae bacterium]|jgi:phosphoglycerate kinase|nr:phosphoglycerate kinase [Candidatus Peribacteraceae bacterium]HCI03313.1 phosphoglycerate kinase [Candidatus Peribacteria bacterium]|tara:strand:+ start:1757 stop:2959 length:1203 start_codon:yes stop_codon:yes gene_type:complete